MISSCCCIFLYFILFFVICCCCLLLLLMSIDHAMCNRTYRKARKPIYWNYEENAAFHCLHQECSTPHENVIECGRFLRCLFQSATSHTHSAPMTKCSLLIWPMCVLWTQHKFARLSLFLLFSLSLPIYSHIYHEFCVCMCKRDINALSQIEPRRIESCLQNDYMTVYVELSQQAVKR